MLVAGGSEISASRSSITLALSRDPSDPSPDELEQLVGVGNELVDAVVLGNRIRNNGRTNNQGAADPEEAPQQGGRLAFTGADLTAFLVVSMLMHVVGMLLLVRRRSARLLTA
jgi:hypothetical protein